MLRPSSLRPNSLATTALLTALVALGPISTDLYLPSLPGLLRHFNADVAQVQLTLSVFLIGLAVGQLAYGPLSDRYGRRPVLLGGVILYVAASIACAFAPSIPALIAARLFQALGACAGPVICRAIVRDVHGREGAARILSYMSAAMALAPALGPILGGYVEAWLGWRANFAILCIYGAGGLALAFAMLPETAPHRGEEGPWLDAALRGYLSLFRQRIYIGFVLCCSLAYGGIFCFISGSSFVFVDIIGLPPERYGLCFAAIVLGYIAGTLAGGRLTRRFGIERMVSTGGLISALGGIALIVSVMAFGATIAGILAPTIVYMIGTGLVMPNAMAGAIGPFPRIAGTAAALLGFVQMGLAALGGALIGHLANGTAIPMAAGIALVGACQPLVYRLFISGAASPGSAAAR
jgi:DHA1 family bicyclomycin/chloramphenicol resistance-like MFS transporter